MIDHSDLNIRHMKLVSGDEVIVLIRDIDPNKLDVIVERPLLIHNELDIHSGRERFFLSDYMPVSKSSIVHISTMHIVAQCEVTDSVKDTYLRYCLNYDTDGVIETGEPDIEDEHYEDYDIDDETTFH